MSLGRSCNRNSFLDQGWLHAANRGDERCIPLRLEEEPEESIRTDNHWYFQGADYRDCDGSKCASWLQPHGAASAKSVGGSRWQAILDGETLWSFSRAFHDSAPLHYDLGKTMPNPPNQQTSQQICTGEVPYGTETGIQYQIPWKEPLITGQASLSRNK